MDPITELSKLIAQSLLTVGLAFVLVYQVAWRIATDEGNGLPSFPKVVVPILIFFTALVLAWRQAALHPALPGTQRELTDDWWIQGFLLAGVLLSAWLGGNFAFSSPSTTKSAARTIASPVAFLVSIALAILFLSAAPARAQDDGAVLSDSVDAVSGKRLAGGVFAGAVMHDDQQATDRVNGLGRGGVSYNLGLLSFGLYGQHEFSKADRTQIGAGVRAVLAELGGAQATVGVDYVWLSGKGYDALEAAAAANGEEWANRTIKVSSRLSKVVLRRRDGSGLVGLQVAAEYIPKNRQLDFPGILAVQIFGGKR